MRRNRSRRDILKLAGIGGTIALTGCVGSGGTGSDGTGSDGTDGGGTDQSESTEATSDRSNQSNSTETSSDGSGGGTQTVRVSGAWALYPMMTVWAEQYNSQQNAAEIKVSGGGSGKGVSDTLNGQNDIGMLSRPPAEDELSQGLFYVAVVKDSVVATINVDNPVREAIYDQGLSSQDLADVFTKEVTTWGEVVGTDNSDEIVVYGRSDASGAAKVWASYLGDYTQNELQQQANANFDGDQPLAEAVSGETNGIGFNNLNFAYNIETGEFAESIRPVPLDQNDNDTLDESEAFYGDRETFLSAVENNEYPSPPARQIYVISQGAFEGAAKDFVNWIYTDGQQYVTENGYVKLAPATLEQEQSFLEAGERGNTTASTVTDGN